MPTQPKANITEYADKLGVSRKTLYLWKDNEGVDIENWEELEAWAKENGKGKYSDTDVKEARRRKTLADADKAEQEARIKRLKADKEQGALIARSEVEESLTGIATRLKGRLLSLAGELPPKLAGLEPEEMEAKIEEAVSAALSELAKEFGGL